MTNLYLSSNYTISLKYILNTYIREYDLSKANINALLYNGKISKEEYLRMMNLPKQQREREIGLRIRSDQTIYSAIKSGITEARRQLFLYNGLQDQDIVSIKNDAVFVIGQPLTQTKFHNFDFKMKNEYNIFLHLKDLEVYYGDTINNDGSISINIDVKGINDSLLPLHENGMLGLICDLCYRLQREEIKETLEWIIDINNKFLSRQLAKEYYRSFDFNSMYVLDTMYMQTFLKEITDEFVPCVNISRNAIILTELISIVSDVYRLKYSR